VARIAKRDYDARTMTRSRLNRFGWIFAAVLQLLVPAFASVADARAEVESRGAYAHVEAHGTPACPRGHEADCIVCRLLASGAAPERPAAVPTRIALVLNDLPARREISCTPTRLAGDPPQRAPPV
jgi:hypothetical protein